MSFLGFEVTRPEALWGLLLVVPLVLLHLYHRRRMVVVFLPLLKEALGPRRPGGGWRRLRDRIALGLRILALVAAVLALAGFVPKQGGPPPPALVLVVDAGVTGRAIESDGRTRYQHGLDAAAAWMRASPWREVTVLEARGTPSVLVPWTDDAGHAWAEGLAPAATDGDLEATLELAMSAARDRVPARVVVLSARPLDTAPTAEGIELEVLGVGEARDDRGIVAFDVRDDGTGPASIVEVAVRNDAAGPRSATLVLTLGETEAGRETLDLEAGEVEVVRFEVTPPPRGAWVQVALAGEDVYAPNDGVSAWLAPPLRPSVLAVHGGSLRPYVHALLEAMGEEIDADASGTVAAADVPRAVLRDVCIVDGASLPAGSLRPGAWIFLAPTGGELPFEVGSELEEPMVWRTAPDHPLVRDVDLAQAYVARGRPVRGEGLVALAEADGQAVLAEGEREGVRYVVLGLDPEGSDLPIRAALPLLLRNAIRRLAHAPTRPFKPFYRPGERLRPRRPLPGGPNATLSCGRTSCDVRLSPRGEAFVVPRGTRGRVEIRTGGGGDAAWLGRTAFVDLDPARTVVPARPQSSLPPPAPRVVDDAARWRRGLVAMALLALLIDLLLLVASRRPMAKLAPLPARG